MRIKALICYLLLCGCSTIPRQTDKDLVVIDYLINLPNKSKHVYMRFRELPKAVKSSDIWCDGVYIGRFNIEDPVILPNTDEGVEIKYTLISVGNKVLKVNTMKIPNSTNKAHNKWINL